jgi:hypothetical protein
MQEKILAVLCRLYNQRQELARLSSKMLILFDEANLKILQLIKKRIKILAKNVEESELWIDRLNEEKA